ncbi:band 4.1-like protein 2, partial [Leptotrombidium deliense]
DSSKGQDLLDVVFKHLNLLESAYFGLRFIDSSGQVCWLDANKKIIKQTKNVNPLTLYFGVKFYASDPCKLLEEITRYQYFLQIKQDIIQSRLPLNSDLTAELFAYAVQSELGDYEPRNHLDRYVSEFRFVPNQTAELEKRVAELHKGFLGQVPATAEMNFLERVKWLDLYGADLHPVLGEDNVEYFLGLTPSGVIVLRNKSKVGNYFWPRILKVYRKGKYFMIKVVEKNNEENTYGFELPNKQACKHLWKCCSEYQAFFRLTQHKEGTQNLGKKVGGFAQRFRYSGRQSSFNKTSNHYTPDFRDRHPPSVVRVPSRRYQKRLGQPDGADATTNNKEEAYKENGYIEVRSSIVIPPGRHITQPVIYRSTSVPNALTTDSPKSIKSVPWENPKQKGLFSSSPHSMRSAITSANLRCAVDGQRVTHRRDSSSSRYRSGRTSDNESEVSKCSKSSHHSRHSHKSSGSHHHRCRHRRQTDESGTESDSSRKRHRRRHKCASNGHTKLIDSEQQWKEIQRIRNEKHESMKDSVPKHAILQTTVARDLVMNRRHHSGYTNSGMESDSELIDSNTLNRTKRRQRSKSPETYRRDALPQEVQRHIEYRLVDPTEDDKYDIRYTRVETDSKLFKIRYSPTTGKARCKFDSTALK